MMDKFNFCLEMLILINIFYEINLLYIKKVFIKKYFKLVLINKN